MRKVFSWLSPHIGMARSSEEKQQQVLRIKSLQSTILGETSFHKSQNLGLQARVNLCWELTEQVQRLIGAKSRALWQDGDGRTTTNTITKEKLLAHLINYSMDSYLRMLYYALVQQDGDELCDTYSHKSHWA